MNEIDVRKNSMKDDETAMEKLRRMVNWLDHEPESLLSDLPCIQAIEEYFDLWKVYGTDFAEGIRECILEGDDPKPWNDFVKKWKLPWETFKKRKKAV